MSSKDRLLDFLKYIRIGQTAFEEKVGLTRGYISKVKKGIGPEMMTKVANTYPELNINWLATGEGEMLKEDTGIPHVENVNIGVPHIESVEAYCGPGQGFDVAVMRKECPVYNIPGMEGADFTIRAKGRSMINRDYPDRSVKEGDYIGCIRCRSGVVRYGEVYALSTSEGVMVKIVQESEREGYVLLESFNREEGFKPFYYPIVDIHDWALVVAVASISRWA
jgi:hypothetical protein